MSVRVDDSVTIAISAARHRFDISEIEKLLETLALFGKTKILQRTAEGVDADEHNFKPYSRSYAEYRKSKGRPTAKVDLNFFGRMLGSMTVKSKNLQASIFFARKEEAQKAAGHSLGLGRLKNAKREFFALSQKDIKDFEKEVDIWLEETLGA